MEFMPHGRWPAGQERARILIVDDSNLVRLYYRHLLEREGHDVEEAINGIEGLEKVFRMRFSLCIVDVNMPMMDGHRFLLALREEAMTRGMPALVTTTQAGEEDRRAALAAGATAYLVKPVRGDLLALQVAALLGRALR
ncbi:response regulator [Acidocella aquatica]|nr:response regulator [Acidocella aquatica]